MPKFTPDYERDKVAQAIRQQRGWDREEMKGFAAYYKEAVRDRGAIQYLELLGGIEKFFQYVKKLPKNKVIDLGAGTARAVGEFSRSEISKDIQFLATDVIRHKELTDNIDTEMFKKTPAEVLKGVEDESVGGLVSVIGAASYSESIPLLADTIDRVLVPGGVFKATLLGWKEKDGKPDPEDQAYWLRYEDLKIFLEENYGFEVYGHSFVHNNEPLVLFIGVKPPYEEKSAMNLLEADLQSSGEQAEKLRKEFGAP